MTEGSFKGVDGITIFTREWHPAGKPHAVVVISHGLNAHSGQYDWLAQQFASKGLAVYALDHRGRGRSEGERFFVKKFADWTTDLATFIDMVKAREKTGAHRHWLSAPRPRVSGDLVPPRVRHDSRRRGLCRALLYAPATCNQPTTRWPAGCRVVASFG